MLALKKVDELPLLPFYIYAMNMMRTGSLLAAGAPKYRLVNGKILHNYNFASKEGLQTCNTTCQDDIEDMLDSPPFLFAYGWNGTRQPQFIKNPNMTSVRQSNLEIALGIQMLQKTPIGKLWWDNDLPDSYILFRGLNDKGFSAHIQVNNLVRKQYHRENGFAFMRTFTDRDIGIGSKERQTVPTIVATEGYAAMMNYFTNVFLQKQTDSQGTPPKIFGVMSPTADSNIILTVADTFYGIICTNAIPVALSLGFPIMLSTLVADKEQKIASLFRVNGLREKNLWFGFYCFYMILLSISSTTFWVLGKRYVDISFFMRTHSGIMIAMFSFWNLAQTSQALLLTKVINTSGTAMTVGYIFAIMSGFFLSGLSLFMFQAPNYLPWYFYTMPQTAFIRFLYLLFVDAAEHRFTTSFSSLKGELLLCFVLLPFLSFVYGVIGINGDRMVKWIKLNLLARASSKFRRLRGVAPAVDPNQREPENVYASVDFSRDYEQLEPVTGLELTPDVADPSVKQYTEEKLQLDPQHPAYPLLAQHISHQFTTSAGEKFFALRDVTLALKRGSITGLLGPNGAGKSTFISIVTRLLVPTEGTVYLRGERIIGSNSEIQGIGYCPQADILMGELTVLEHLGVFHRLKGLESNLRDEDIRQLLVEVQLWEHRDKPANALSGGMKRRLSLAICLIGHPQVIYLDEPTNGLDPVLRKSFWVLLQSVLRNKAVLITTHLLSEVEVLCNEVAVLVDGQLRVIGHPGTVKKNYSGGPRIQLIFKNDASSEQIDQTTDQLQELFPNSVVNSSNINPKVFYIQSRVLGARGTQFDLKSCFGWLTDQSKDHNSPLDSWSISLGGLEDAFLTIVDKYSTKQDKGVFSDVDVVRDANRNHNNPPVRPSVELTLTSQN